MASDRELINFSEDHELDHILKKIWQNRKQGKQRPFERIGKRTQNQKRQYPHTFETS